MIFGRAVLGTEKRKTKMSWWDYWIGHCWMTGWQSINYSFRNWGDLMTGNWKDYALMFYDDPFEECRECFWSYLGDDDTYPKAFLEHLQEMVDRIDRGEEELIPMDEAFMNRLKNLTKDDEIDLNELLENEDETTT